MVFDDLKISGTGEALLDFNELWSVKLKLSEKNTSLHDKTDED